MLKPIAVQGCALELSEIQPDNGVVFKFVKRDEDLASNTTAEGKLILLGVTVHYSCTGTINGQQYDANASDSIVGGRNWLIDEGKPVLLQGDGVNLVFHPDGAMARATIAEAGQITVLADDG